MLALLIERVVARQREAGGDLSFFIGRDRRLRRLVRDAEVLARTSLPLLVTGETGVGKSAFVERIIHPATRRRGPFVAVDLAALPETLVSAELFGTSRGAFSGAVDRPGCLERAHHGTLLLDEIGNLASEAQRALLTTLQTRRVTRLGGTQARELDVKVVTATNADLAALVAGGRMRADLLARLNPAARLTLPPLRERPEDLPALAAHLVTRLYSGGPDHELLAAYAAAARLDGPSPEARLATTGERPATGREIVFTLTPRELGLLIRHPWPGNVRELEQVLAAATLAALGDALQAAEAGRSPGTPAARRVIPIPPRIWRELLGADAPATRRPAVADAPSATLHDVARELERRLYARLFVECQGDFAAMAGRLLVGDPGANARRVRLRFNQLGLRARALSADSI